MWVIGRDAPFPIITQSLPVQVMDWPKVEWVGVIWVEAPVSKNQLEVSLPDMEHEVLKASTRCPEGSYWGQS